MVVASGEGWTLCISNADATGPGGTDKQDDLGFQVFATKPPFEQSQRAVSISRLGQLSMEESLAVMFVSEDPFELSSLGGSTAVPAIRIRMVRIAYQPKLDPPQDIEFGLVRHCPCPSRSGWNPLGRNGESLVCPRLLQASRSRLAKRRSRRPRRLLRRAPYGSELEQ